VRVRAAKEPAARAASDRWSQPLQGIRESGPPRGTRREVWARNQKSLDCYSAHRLTAAALKSPDLAEEKINRLLGLDP